MKLKRIVSSYELICPKCGEPIPCPDNGSFSWPRHYPIPEKVRCENCQKDYAISTKYE